MAKALDTSSLYDMDYVAWLSEQVAHLRAGRLHELDVENVAEELESLVKKERRQFENRLEVLILHLLEWTISQPSGPTDGAPQSTSSARASDACSVTAQA